MDNEQNNQEAESPWQYNPEEPLPTDTESIKEDPTHDSEEMPSDDFTGGPDNRLHSNSITGDNNQQITDSVLTGNIAGGNIIETQVHVNLKDGESLSEEDKMFPCLHCGTLLDGSHYGKIICTNPKCGKPSFRLNTKISVSNYPKIANKQDVERYKKVLDHINNKLKDGNYNTAFRYCLEAEQLAPGEPQTWEYFALTEFYRELYRHERKMSVYNIVAIVKIHLAKCLDYGIEKERYELISGDIANKLFNQLKKDINRYSQIYASRKDSKWASMAVTALRAFELCYSLYDDVTFLIAYVAELSRDYKWLVETRKGIITELPFCGRFKAASNRQRVIEKIKVIQPGYENEIPLIRKERFEYLGSTPGKKVILLSKS